MAYVNRKNAEKMQPLVKNSLQQAVTLVIVYLSTCSASLLEGIYCGRDNCYDVLNVTRESTTIEISRAYRQMAKVHHPDRHRTKEAKIDAEEKFKLIGMLFHIFCQFSGYLKNEQDKSASNPCSPWIFFCFFSIFFNIFLFFFSM